MRLFTWIVFGLLLLVGLLAEPVLARLAHPRTDCTNRIVLVNGLRGQPVECVCIDGTLAACFASGP